MFYHFDIIAATKFIVFRTNTQIFLKIITADLKKKKSKVFSTYISDDRDKEDRQQHSIKIWCFFVNELTNFRVVCKLVST